MKVVHDCFEIKLGSLRTLDLGNKLVNALREHYEKCDSIVWSDEANGS